MFDTSRCSCNGSRKALLLQGCANLGPEQSHVGDFEDQMRRAGGCAGVAELGSSNRNSFGDLQAEMGCKAIASSVQVI